MIQQQEIGLMKLNEGCIRIKEVLLKWDEGCIKIKEGLLKFK